MDFISPIDLGEVAIVEAFVFDSEALRASGNRTTSDDTGRTSIDVKVNVRAEDPREDEERETTTSFFTFVALDDEGTPTPVPDLDCPTDNQRALRDAAREQRREQFAEVADRIGKDE